jgi:hypothetical protein
MIPTCSHLKARRRAFFAGVVLAVTAAAPRPACGQWSTGSGGAIYYNGGNVGLGTTGPTSRLHVYDPSGVLARFQINNSAVEYRYTELGYDSLNARLGDGFLTNLYLQEGALTVRSAGNVGIGTTNPQYKLAVNGNIGAQDIIVTNTGWSDYVFQPGYRLRPLSEVSAFIQKHHHLPDIPTEAEVKEKGVSLGDMQAKLLAKVEELTLHLIQQEQQNQKLRERLGQLEKRVPASSEVPSGR